MFVGELFDAVPGAAEDDRHVLENRAEGHRRLVSPLLGLTLVMIALAAMLVWISWPGTRLNQGVRAANSRWLMPERCISSPEPATVD